MFVKRAININKITTDSQLDLMKQGIKVNIINAFNEDNVYTLFNKYTVSTAGAKVCPHCYTVVNKGKVVLTIDKCDEHKNGEDIYA